MSWDISEGQDLNHTCPPLILYPITTPRTTRSSSAALQQSPPTHLTLPSPSLPTSCHSPISICLQYLPCHCLPITITNTTLPHPPSHPSKPLRTPPAPLPIPQNILAYNLFSSCPSAAQRLRLLYTYLASADCLTDAQLHEPRYNRPAFDPVKHVEFNTDLKNLYVVVTRARCRLLLHEENREVQIALQDFFQLCRRGSSSGGVSGRGSGVAEGGGGGGVAGGSDSGGLVQVQGLESGLLECLQKESSSEEWRRVGEELFLEGKYERAEVGWRNIPGVLRGLICLPLLLLSAATQLVVSVPAVAPASCQCQPVCCRDNLQSRTCVCACVRVYVRVRACARACVCVCRLPGPMPLPHPTPTPLQHPSSASNGLVMSRMPSCAGRSSWC